MIPKKGWKEICTNTKKSETESERVFHGTVLLDGTALLHVFTALDPRCLSGIAEIAKISEVRFNEFIYLSSVL